MTEKPSKPTQTKLELTWPGKQNRPRLEPRILLEDKAFSYHAAPSAAADLAEQADAGQTAFDDNLLIHGDNLLALKALESKYAGKVKCVFIDPPYNTGSAFTHYDDGVEHSMWLTLIRDRLEVIRTLLAEDGSLWITIDDNEAHYLKVVCDEVFGRGNFVANVLWQKRTSPEARLQLGAAHDHILVYGRSQSSLTFNKLSLSEDQEKNYKNHDNDPRGPWTSADFTAQGWRPNQMYKLTTKAGVEYEPPPGRCWGNVESEFKRLVADNRIWFGKDGAARPRVKNFLREASGISAWSWWTNSEVGHNQEAKKEINQLFGAEDAFSTPKPERLLKRVLEIATNPGDLVLDSFAGSGTTGAVAHKMGRRWIMVELGEHCHTHIVPRLKKVIDGQDPGGITKTVNWRGGGGFRYYRLAPSLLKKDKWGHWVINPDYNAEMLSEAMCKLMGFTYAPSQAYFWQHGQSTETDFIYVTTGSLSHDQLRIISEEVGSERSLLICCKAFMADTDAFPNLTLKKIPKTVLHKCQWDQDDYSFKIDVLAEPEPLPEEEDEFELNAENEGTADE
ncbi:site-specific DNA-methyltransferase [Ralstonia pseudosolanacearum]|uniref:site-specific DNA-methyltransferase n=1 Tax=Ralstonia pseudosolanacearum TaxID=1310165 RepID=UPI000490B8BB|nr:site-specific DNA-methyltransferase [Ralstonia pseudosolanacearum]MDO3558663.1 site-specific DNA-methyltransferase [Ralstonia pseudosolanacearum]MDO3575117.1 site-specific DNA-methyltransferase [Ralstonia pseudosolanacearum]MDO3585001.1 site-specific DNA-methyltransferase [Ralstonia pseudosolanacearum]